MPAFIAAPGHLVEGTTFPTGFIGAPRKDFTGFFEIRCNLQSNQLFPSHADYETSRTQGKNMIELTRLNGTTMLLNSDLVKTAEASPDTMLTLINGEKLIVREELNEVMERVLTYRSKLLCNVARRLSSGDPLTLVPSLASLDVSEISNQTGREDDCRNAQHSPGYR